LKFSDVSGRAIFQSRVLGTQRIFRRWSIFRKVECDGAEYLRRGMDVVRVVVVAVFSWLSLGRFVFVRSPLHRLHICVQQCGDFFQAPNVIS
jgi:hypothetical protein